MNTRPHRGLNRRNLREKRMRRYLPVINPYLANPVLSLVAFTANNQQIG